MTSKAVPPSPSLAPRLLRPLAVGVAASSVSSLSAAILYTGNSGTYGVSTSFSITGGVGDNTPDFVLDVFPGVFPNESKPAGAPSNVTLNSQNMALITTPTTFGDFIDINDLFNNSSPVPDGQNYYGFSIQRDTTTLYGWLSVTHNSSPGTGTGTLNGWAYDDTGAGISVGAVPEPANFAAVAALLAGSAAVWKRRRVKIEALAA